MTVGTAATSIWICLFSQIKGLDDVSLKLWLTSAGRRQYYSSNSSSPPHCHYVNVSMLPVCKLKCDSTLGTLLLENPVGQNVMSYERLLKEVINPLLDYKTE